MHVDLLIFSEAWNGERYALHAYDTKGHGNLVDTLPNKDQQSLTRSIISMVGN